MLDVSGAGTAGTLALSSVNHRMRELILKHQPLQVNILSRALTARAFRIAGSTECIEFKMRDDSLESFEKVLSLIQGSWQPEIYANALRYVKDDRVQHILDLFRKRSIPIFHIQTLAILFHRASSTAFDAEMSAFKRKFGEHPEYVAMLGNLTVACPHKIDSTRNLLAKIHELQAKEIPPEFGKYIERLQLSLDLYQYHEHKENGEQGKTLFEIARAHYTSYLDDEILFKTAILQLEEESPGAFQKTLDILNLSSPHDHYHFFVEATDKNKLLFHNINRLSKTNRYAQDIVNYMVQNKPTHVIVCYIESFFSEASSKDLLETYDADLIDEFFEMSEPAFILAMKRLSRILILNMILAWIIKNEKYVFAWQIIVDLSKISSGYVTDSYLKELAVKAATSNKPGALQYALSLVNTIKETKICASALFELAKNCKFKDLPLVPIEGSIVSAIAELANEWPRRKTFGELTRFEITKIGELLRPETATLETHAIRAERKKKIEKRTLLKQNVKTALQEIDQDSSSAR
jgi:hypothetical protein